MAAGIDLKVQILKRSIGTFSTWLNSCDKLLDSLPEQLQQCDQPKLRDLAFKYKDFLLQMKERCTYMQEVNSLCKEVTTEVLPTSIYFQRCTEVAGQIRDLNNRFARMCMEAKQLYSNLSLSLAASISESASPRSHKVAPLSPQHYPNSVSFSETLSPSSSDNTLLSEEIEEIISLDGSPIIGRRRNLNIPTSPPQASENVPDSGYQVFERQQETTPLSNDESLPESKSPQAVNLNLMTQLSPTLRERALTESTHVAMSDRGTADTSLRGSEEPLDSDRWETSSLHSVHSLQNRIIYATMMDSASQSMDSLDHSSSDESRRHMRAYSSDDTTVHPKVNGSAEVGLNGGRSSDSIPQTSIDLAMRLKNMSEQIQEYVHTIAENRMCGLQSLELELHLGEIKAMMTLLEVQEFELVHLRATFSPSAQRKLAEERGRHKLPTLTQFSEYPSNEIRTNRDEILKLSERVELLHTHCTDAIGQTEEVLEFVMQFEGEVKGLKEFLSGTRAVVTRVREKEPTYHEVTWVKLREALTAVNEHKPHLSSIEQLSTQLLYLEPIFAGDPVRDEMQTLSKDYQSLVLEIFDLLEGQARSRTEQLLLDVSLMSAWVTETELSVQALAKRTRKPNGMSTKIAATREQLIRELEKRKTSLLAISDQLQPIAAVLPPDRHPSLRDLLVQVEKNTKRLLQIESGLITMVVDLKTSGNGLRLSRKGKEQRSEVARGSLSPPEDSEDDGMYNRLDEVTSPPSPLVEYDQIPSRVLDSAIERLPKQQQQQQQQQASSPPKRHVPYVVIDLSDEIYDHPRSMHSVTLHEELLRFISQEWANLGRESNRTQEEAALLESIGCLDNPEHRIICQHFVKSLEDTEANLKGVMEQISAMRVPNVPDLEKVHNAIDICQKLKSQLEKLYPTVEGYNEQSLVVVASLPRGQVTSRVSQQMEIKLFDVSMMWHTANMQVATKLQEVRGKEGEVNSLYRQLQTVSRALEEAKTILEEKKNLSDVKEYLRRCKEMQRKLSGLSEQRNKLSSEIKGSVMLSPQSQVSHKLMDELRELETQWVNTMKALSEMPVLEPILIKQVFTNVSKELGVIETAVPLLEDRTLKLEELSERCQSCQVHLQKAKQLQASLNSTYAYLTNMKPGDPSSKMPDSVTPYEEPIKLRDKSSHSAAPDGASGISNVSRVPAPDSGISNVSRVPAPDGGSAISNVSRVPAPDGGSAISNVSRVPAPDGGSGISKSENVLPVSKKKKAYAEIMITPQGAELVSINYSQMSQHCLALIEKANRVVSNVEGVVCVMESERTKLEKFHKELKELQLWIADTKEMIEMENQMHEKRLQQEGEAAKTRGKYQAICHQVVARQQKMESLQSLATDVMLLPGTEEERRGLEKQLSTLYCDWDEICQQCVPAGSLPLMAAHTDHDCSFLAPSEFEDVSQMVEWLILIESKLQPERMVVGDFLQMRRMLRDLQIIERELKSKTKDYNRFLRESSDSITPELQSPTSFFSQFSPKCVKFIDENTLERRQRRQEIKDGNQPIELLDLEDSQILSSSDGSIWRALPPGMEWRLPPGIELRSIDTGMEPGSRDGRSSLSPSLSQMTSPTSLLPDEIYQLTILWRGIWTMLNQRRQHLEAIRDIWGAFESRKEAFSSCLVKAEDRLSSLFTTLSGSKDLAVIQAEFTAQQSFSEEVHMYEQRLSTLNDLARDLINNHHANDDTHDLQDTMKHLNERWRTVFESFTQHHPTIMALSLRWSEFYSQYQAAQQWLRNMDIEMSNLNPFVSDMAAVRLQLEKQKEIHQELNSREGALEAIRVQAYKVLQGIGGCHINAMAVHSKLDNMARRWDHLQQLAQERKSALEQALTEKQTFLSQMADCLTWLNLAEKHMDNQKPLGSDFYRVHEQYQAHLGFWQEIQEQKRKMESVIAAGKHIVMETHWPQGTPEWATADSLRAQYGTVEERWGRVYSEGEEWMRQLEMVHPEMQQFQALCTECGQRLSEAEMGTANFEPVSNKMAILNQQLDMLQQFESHLVSLGDILEAIVTSQKRQLQMGVKVLPDLLQLVLRFHQRWNELKQVITTRHSTIERAMVKYNPENMGVASLPRGWHRAKTENGTPYYINANDGNETQWEHPSLSDLYDRLEMMHTYSCYPSSTYPVALKLRAIQKKTQLNLLQTRLAMEAFEEDQCYLDPYRLLTCSDMTVLALNMFQKAEEEPLVASNGRLYVSRATELSSSWLRDVYDIAHEGAVSCQCIQIATICMSQGKLEEKYRCLFQVISRNQGSIDLDQLTEFLEQVIQIPQSVCEMQYCPIQSVDVCARECFRRFVGMGTLHLPQFIAWLQTEPKPVAWLPVLHRLAASEGVQHDSKCSVCKIYPIVGFSFLLLNFGSLTRRVPDSDQSVDLASWVYFRGYTYHCLQCNSFDMCQNCYWSGKTAKGHDRARHFMEEYCVAKHSGEEVKDFFKSLHRSFRRKKKKSLEQQEAAASGYQDSAPSHAHTYDTRRDTREAYSPPAKRKHSTRCTVNIGDNPHHGEGPPGAKRRYTSPEEVRGHRRMGSKDIHSPPPPPVPLRLGPEVRVPPSYPHDTPHKLSRRRQGLRRDLDSSLTQLSEDNRHVSDKLRGLREHRSSSSLTESPQRDTEHSPSPERVLKCRNSFLHGRVQLLQEHNQKLESCIGQLKVIASTHQHPGEIGLHSPTLPLQNGTPPVHTRHYLPHT